MQTFTVGEEISSKHYWASYNRVKGFLRNFNPAINPELLTNWEPTVYSQLSSCEAWVELATKTLTDELLEAL